MALPLIGELADLVTSNPCTDSEHVCDAVYDWTGNEQAAEFAGAFIGTPLSLIGIAIVGLVVRWLLQRVVDRVVRRAEEGVLPDRLNRMAVGRGVEDGGSAGARRVQRARTMGDLLKSVITGVVLAVVVTMMLAELDYAIGPIIASAGIIGVALGFGAQNLVKDFLAGIFMIFETGTSSDLSLSGLGAGARAECSSSCRRVSRWTAGSASASGRWATSRWTDTRRIGDAEQHHHDPDQVRGELVSLTTGHWSERRAHGHVSPAVCHFRTCGPL